MLLHLLELKSNSAPNEVVYQDFSNFLHLMTISFTSANYV